MSLLTERSTILTNMRTGYASLSFLFTILIPPAVSMHYTLKDKYVGNDFYSGFKWETDDDPTHGRVNYVDQGTGISKNLTSGAF